MTVKAGQRSATVSIPILDDTADERREFFLVTFKPAAGSTSATPSPRHRAHHKRSFPTPVLAPVTILDND